MVLDPAATLELACACLGALWVVLAAVTLVNRAVYDRWRRSRRRPLAAAGGRRERRLLRRAAAHSNGLGRWRRIAAIQALAAAGHPKAPRLLRRALADPDREIVAAAIRALGEVGEEWAAEQLVRALREDRFSRSRIAAQLERLAPRIGHLLVPLLADPEAPVRFWGATLLARYPGVAVEQLAARTRDDDPNVRAAAVEALGASGDGAALAAALALLADPAWFVRAHACRAVGALGSAEVAPRVAELLADDWWWVRNAAKDALRGLGASAVPAVVPLLEHEDRFARNSAAEVLQDVGFVDELVARQPNAPLLARIYAAGGRRLREAAESRGESLSHGIEEAA